MPPKPKSTSPILGSHNSKKPVRTRRTNAQIDADCAASGSKKKRKGKPSQTEVRRSLKASRERESRGINEDSTEEAPAAVSTSRSSEKSKSKPANSTRKARATVSTKEEEEEEAEEAEEEAETHENSPPFQKADYLHIVTYISQPKIFDLLFGSGKRTKVTGLSMTPTTILNSLAEDINNDYNKRNKVFSHSQSQPNKKVMQLTGKVLRDRLDRYKRRYSKTKAWLGGTGAGTTEKQRAQGMTLDDVLEKKCSCFYQMNTLFKDKPNISALGILDSGIGGSQISKRLSDSSDNSLEEPDSNTEAQRQPLADCDYPRPTTIHESHSALQRFIASAPVNDGFSDYDFRPLPPPIKPPAGYFFDDYMGGIQQNFSPLVYSNDKNQILDGNFVENIENKDNENIKDDEDEDHALNEFNSDSDDSCSKLEQDKEICPFCDEPLPAAPSRKLIKLKDILMAMPNICKGPGRAGAMSLPWTQTADFCSLHEAERSVIPQGVSKGWPTIIDFDGLEVRIKNHTKLLSKIVNKIETSVYFDYAEEKRCNGKQIDSLKDHLLGNIEIEQPGYYGYQGYVIFVRTLENIFIKDKTSRHHLNSQKAAPLSPDGFLRQVLIPETAICLIAEDMSLDRLDPQVKATLEESRGFGVAVFPIKGDSINSEDENEAQEKIIQTQLPQQSSALADTRFSPITSKSSDNEDSTKVQKRTIRKQPPQKSSALADTRFSPITSKSSDNEDSVDEMLNEIMGENIDAESNGNDTLQNTQPSQKSSYKRSRKQPCPESDDSEIFGPPKKKSKKGKLNIASRSMDPLPAIDPSTVRNKDIKNPIALALMTGSQARTEELKENNKRRQALDAVKNREAQDRLKWEKLQFKISRSDENKRTANENTRAESAERVKFARDLALGGKTPEEVQQYINAVFPPPPPVQSTSTSSLNFM